MSGGEKVPWARGMAVAQAFLGALGPVYGEARVAGSLRRGGPSVGDVELVLAPAFDGALNRLDQRCDELLRQGVVTKRLNRLGRAIAWGDGKTPSRYKALTFEQIEAETNLEVRRLMIDRFGRGRYIRESGATIRHQETFRGRCYTLYERQRPDATPLVMVHCINATAEADGSFREFFIRVNPDCQTAIEAIASTFHLKEDAYRRLGFES